MRTTFTWKENFRATPTREMILRQLEESDPKLYDTKIT
jgi:hypothetical protein